ncbi:MAG: hypothetical protein H0W87_03455 [Actinobacteria bacterium]|nr:hypothetical protein [Actinomycetota bacterium]
MSDPEHVLDRLRRIEWLERESAPAATVLNEVRALLADAEAWVRSEGHGNAAAEAAVAALRDALDGGEETALAAERTLVA